MKKELSSVSIAYRFKPNQLFSCLVHCELTTALDERGFFGTESPRRDDDLEWKMLNQYTD